MKSRNKSIMSNSGGRMSDKFEKMPSCLTELNSPNGRSDLKSMNLDKQLKFYLEKTGMNASELARKSGVSRQSLSDWLGGRSPRNLFQIKKIADCLNTTIDNLCFGTKDAQSTTTHLSELLGEEWLSGVFEIRLRRVPQKEKK